MEPDFLAGLAAYASGLDRVEESVACRGTPLEKITYQVRGKNFLFLGKADLLLKLRESLEEAAGVAEDDPQAVRVGKHGWVTIVPGAAREWRDRLQRWIAESHIVVSRG